MPNDVKDFFDDAEEVSLDPARIPDGYYHFRIAECRGRPDWAVEANKAVIECSVVVASGEYSEQYGPRLRFELGGFQWTDKKTGAAREVTAVDQKNRLFTLLKRIHGPTLPKIPANVDDVTVLELLGDHLAGDEFIARVVTEKKEGGYQRYYDIHSMDDPPKGFIPADDYNAFRS